MLMGNFCCGTPPLGCAVSAAVCFCCGTISAGRTICTRGLILLRKGIQFLRVDTCLLGGQFLSAKNLC